MRLNVKKMSFAKNKKPLMRDSRRWRSRSNKVKSRSKRKSVGGRLRKKKRKRRKLSLQLIVQRSKQPKNKSVGFNYNWKALKTRILRTKRGHRRSHRKKLHQRAVRFYLETLASTGQKVRRLQVNLQSHKNLHQPLLRLQSH